ncbi:DUF6894 family protein [Sphingomonas glacialis]|uniref:DUF6894 domain-containing protein n=1 Tax=Sphingomonas glacialis TaxID=658225 RepID=A0A502FZJ8_9SPHN|nr:hypothetical protein [Sphingomonas glacialis]TPG54313.1 hypothetical protein EAH76_06460 [Sphingomonas glacialis]
MPRWYFHLYQAGDLLIDPEGVELADLAGVRARALAVARDLIAADAASGVLYLDTRLSIVDDRGVAVLDVAFSDAVAFISGPGTSDG